MATTRGFSGWRAISKLEESAYNSAATISSTFRNAADPINMVVELADGTELVGSAAEEANEQDILAQRAEGNEDLPRLRPNEAALYLGFALGNVNQSLANEPATDYYTHTFSPFPLTFTNGSQDGSGVPLTTITVEDTGSFPSSGSITVEASGNSWTYTGKTATTFTGVNSCSDNLADNTAIRIKLPDYDYILPSFTVLDFIGATLKKEWTGMMVRRFEISGDRKGFVRAAGQLVGSGSVSSPGTARPAEITETYLRVGDAIITISGTFNGTTFSGGTAIRTDVRSFSWFVENDIPDDLVYTIGGGAKMGRAERARRRQGLNIALEFDNATELNYVLNQTDLNLLLRLVGSSGSWEVKLIFPQFKFSTTPISGGVGVLMQSLDAAIQHHTTYGSVFAQVMNKQASYLN